MTRASARSFLLQNGTLMVKATGGPAVPVSGIRGGRKDKLQIDLCTQIAAIPKDRRDCFWSILVKPS